MASGHPAVSEAACEVLRAGGNAVDAALAAGFAGAVAEPALTSLGGGGFLLVRDADGRAELMDFFVDTPGRGHPAPELVPHFVPVTVRFPAAEQVFNAGLGSVAVPGNLRGFLAAHAAHGCIPLETVLQPAVALARGGVPLNAHQAYFLELLTPIVTLTQRGRALFQPQGRAPRPGERLANPELADFLEALPRGAARDFHEGELARRIEREMRDGQGLLTAEDLASYRVVERAPLRVRYRGHELLTNPPPSFGGSLVALGLRLLDAQGGAVRDTAGPEACLGFAAVMREVEALREVGSARPEALDDEAARAAALRMRRFSRGTTHVSVCDRRGNAASLTTSNGEGSGYLAPGTGIMLNNMLGEDDLHPEGFFAAPPGERVASMMSPSVLLRDGALRLVLGSGGSKRIRTAIPQVIRHVVEGGCDVEDAVRRPRLHWDGEQLQVEPGLPEASLRALRALPVPVNVWERLDVYFGGVHAVGPAGDGGGDPRRGGVFATA